jgi:hypothetical protein
VGAAACRPHAGNRGYEDEPDPDELLSEDPDPRSEDPDPLDPVDPLDVPLSADFDAVESPLPLLLLLLSPLLAEEPLLLVLLSDDFLA